MPAKLWVGVPSPQFTPIDEIEPSISLSVKDTVTSCRVFAGFGDTLLMVTVGGWSFIVSDEVPDPGPASLVPVTVIVKICDLTLPVDA